MKHMWAFKVKLEFAKLYFKVKEEFQGHFQGPVSPSHVLMHSSPESLREDDGGSPAWGGKSWVLNHDLALNPALTHCVLDKSRVSLSHRFPPFTVQVIVSSSR